MLRPDTIPMILRAVVPLSFVAFLFFNGVGTILGWRFLPSFDENRTLAGRPAWSGSLAAGLRSFDDYIKDNFPTRKPFLLAYNSALYYGFKSANTTKVIIGRNGWIFGADYDSADGRIESPPLSESYLRKLRISLEERRDWLKEQGIAFLVMFYPTKTTVYGKKYLPAHVKLDPAFRSAARQLADHLGNRLQESWIFLEPPLAAAAAQTDDYYYRTDTHATHQGAFVAIQAMTAHLQRWHPGVPFRHYPDHELKPDLLYPTAYGRIMGIPFKELSYVSMPLDGFATRLAEIPAGLAPLVPPGSQTVFLENKSAGTSTSVLVGDSFSDRMIFYMGEIFSSALTLELNRSPTTPEGRFPVALFRAMKPDVVAMAYVESRLVDPDSPGRGDVIPLINPAEVRQSRLRRLFAASPRLVDVRFKPFQSSQKTAFEVVVPAAPHDSDLLLLRLNYSGEKPITLSRDYLAGVASAENDAVELGPQQRTALLLIPRAASGALGALRTDHAAIDPSLLSADAAWVSVSEL